MMIHVDMVYDHFPKGRTLTFDPSSGKKQFRSPSARSHPYSRLCVLFFFHHPSLFTFYSPLLFAFSRFLQGEEEEASPLQSILSAVEKHNETQRRIT